MDRERSATRVAKLLLVCASMLLGGSALAAGSPQNVKLTAADTAAAAGAKFKFLSATPKSTTNGGAGFVMRTDIGAASHGGQGGNRRYPGDLVNNGGTTIPSATQHTLYLLPAGTACVGPPCYGNPEQFLTDLNRSGFIHVNDQYLGTSAGNRYPFVGYWVGGRYTPTGLPLTDADMAAWAHALAGSSLPGVGFGTSHIVHIFLPPEQDVCFDTSYSVCSSNYFCAYHSSAIFQDGTEVVYTVEPYVMVPGCAVPPGTPNGAYDATYSVLSHEIFETITDPEGTAWWNSSNLALYGEEIGDECSYITFAYPPGVYFDPATVNLNGHAYAVQAEYSNSSHACTTSASN